MAKKVSKNLRHNLKVSRLKKPVVSAPKKDSLNFIEKAEKEISSNQSKVSMVLGALIVIVLGILIFNYFKGQNNSALGPAQQLELSQKDNNGDVSKENLPGSYTVKEGDTLFLIAEKYYSLGDKFTEIVKANKIQNPDLIEKGQILQIPKLEDQQTTLAAVTTPSPEASASPEQITPKADGGEFGTGTGGGNTTIWGSKIEGDKYTVQNGDWLSTIAARAYGDINAFEKIAKANNIQNADLIESGWVLVIPR